MDLVITGGTVYDGSGDEPFVADVGVSGGRISAVGEVAANGDEVVDASGLCVAAGFIDPHTHSDGLLGEPGARATRPITSARASPASSPATAASGRSTSKPTSPISTPPVRA